MGGRSKSSNTTTSNNNSGQNAISGDNLGTAISGVTGSTINIEATDHGAVEGALELGGELLEQNGKVVKDSLNFADRTVGDSLKFGRESLKVSETALKEGVRFGETALEEGFRFGDTALKESLDTVNSTVNSSLKLVENNARDSLKFANATLEEYSEANSENLQLMAGLSGSQAKQNADSLNKIMELAKFNKDGGQNQGFKYQVVLLGVVIVVMAIVAIAASRK